jgi:hypothetical protein
MSKNPFHTFEVVVTNKLQQTVSHQVMHASSWRIEYFINDYVNVKDYKGFSVWVRKQLNSLEMSDNSGWSWNIKAKNDQEAKDYSALVEWEPWENAIKNPGWIRSVIEADNLMVAKLQQEEREKQNA